MAQVFPRLVVLGVLVACSNPRSETTAVALMPAPAVRTVAMVMLQLSDDATQPFAAADLRSLAFTDQYSARAFYLEWSFGLLSIEGLSGGATGDVFGWYPIAATSAFCNLAEFMAEGRAAAMSTDGVDLDTYDSVVYTWNAAACSGGDAPIPGSFVFLSPNNAMGYAGALAHELGHNMGLQHSGSLQCLDGAGAPIALSTNCTPDEYGDSFDVMGPDADRMTAFHKEQLGWFGDANKQIATTTGDYVIAPLEQASTGVQGLRIHRPNDAAHDLYLDFRQPFGLDNYFPYDPAVNGVMIRLVPTTITDHQPALLDMTPATPATTDASLLVGQTFDDTAAGIHVTTTAVDPTGATVHIVIDPAVIPADAAVDAPTDAASDAASDAGSDAAPPPDAAIADAAMPDAALPDAALPDAGMPAMRDSGIGPDASGVAPDQGGGGCCSAAGVRFDGILLALIVAATVRRRRRRT